MDAPFLGVLKARLGHRQPDLVGGSLLVAGVKLGRLASSSLSCY